MKKKILIILIILTLLISFAIVYLNKVVLPIKIKTLIIKGIADATGKKVSLGELKFNLFKGLVLTDLKVYDDTQVLVSLKEGSCVFFILPLFKKQIVIPNLRLKSAVLFLERKSDNTLNILEPFTKGPIAGAKNNFGLFIYKISLTDTQVNFQDDTLSPAFSKQINKLNAVLALSLPTKVKFNLKFEIPSDSPIKVDSAGEYNITQDYLASKIRIRDLAPQDFMAYYQNLAISFGAGKMDALLNLSLKEKILSIDVEVQSKDLTLAKDKILAKLNTLAKAKLVYNLKNKQVNYSGNSTINNLDISGLEVIDTVSQIKGDLNFDNTGLSGEQLSANVLGIPFETKINLQNFANPLINIYATSQIDLHSAVGLLENKFKFSLPADIQGQGRLSLSLESRLPPTLPLQINGSLDVLGATAKLNQLNSTLENISGKITFSANRLNWDKLNFRYLDTDYTASGALTNFQAPAVQLSLSSQDLSLESLFAVRDSLINFSKCQGRYLNSDFSFTGDVDTRDSKNINTDIAAKININLKDLSRMLVKFKDGIIQINPTGRLHIDGTLAGNINDIKSCSIEAKLSSDSTSIYGLKATDLLINYNQQDRIADMALLHLSLYDGTIDAMGKMNLASENLPYWMSADIQGVKIEKLKMDTPAKDKDIAGTIQAQAKINGFSGDLSKLSGAGKITVSEGNLWQLNLFKGIGALLFTDDFTNVVFSEGYCDFSIHDKYVFTDNLKLKSSLCDMAGAVKIGFDSSIDASLNVEVSQDAQPTGSIKDFTTAILGQAKKFGVIRITGTLKDPKYKFKTAVVDIIKGIKDTFFKE
jgi:uncharacterized protein involved in outer membrane biogenesis